MNTLKELYLEAARVAEMIEGSDLAIGDCVKYRNEPMNNWVVVFNNEPDLYEFALSIVGGKPVFKGDKLWFIGSKNSRAREFIATPSRIGSGYNVSAEDGGSFRIEELSWNPPKRTVMVEMLVEDAEYFATTSVLSNMQQRMNAACRKALDNLKG